MTKKRRRKQSRILPVRVTARSDSTIALEVDGVVQSISLPPEDGGCLPSAMTRDQLQNNENNGVHTIREPQPGPDGGYWGLLIPLECPHRALLLGLGGGTVAHLLARRCPETQVTGIEHDPQVLRVARSQFGLESLPQLRIVEADAFTWVGAQCKQDQSARDCYDLICLDLFQAGRLAEGTLSKPFLRQIAELISPGGWLTVNLMITARTPSQLHRLQQVFAITWQRRLRGNLIVHGRPLAPEDGDATASQLRS
ncbi:MAG: spermidine synthase [Ktedonobacterales bacterium]